MADSYTYDVFLSFRGEDTRCNFTDHLYNALRHKGIHTFIDAKLPRGEEISAELVKAIEECRVSIIVFSENYASSRWCLDELVHILHCKASNQQMVRPVFYKVDPSDVRNQTGDFGKAFAELDRRKYKDSMDKWRTALSTAASLSGWPFSDGEYESQFISKIVEELSSQVLVHSYNLDVAKYPIGIESCVQDLHKLLNMEKNTVRMVGIWGTGGIGKTTIAKAVFNSIGHKFEGSCFLADIRSNSIPHGGLAQLQSALLFEVLGDSNLKVPNVDIGLSLIKKRMQQKKVVLILDDVSDLKQLDNLAPSSDCFGPGSRIIITTRDQRCLTAHQVDSIYEVKMLDDDRALELFSLNAFRINRPPDHYLKLAKRAVRYAQGLPLALTVLGSHLFKRSRDEWEATLDSCNGFSEIRDILKISYYALGEDYLKELFLDIACFFKGKRVDLVKSILKACYDLKSMIGIAQLQEKALIRIDRNEIWMHDLIEEMGKDIVLREGEPGERSRLWNHNDVNHVLTDDLVTDKIKGIQVNWEWGKNEMCLNSTGFSKMKNLRYFSSVHYSGKIDYLPKLRWRNRHGCPMQSFPSNFPPKEYFSSEGVGVHYSGNIDYLSNKLRWLNWHGCPMQSFPSNFHPKELVVLNICYSHCITRLWEGRKIFPNLTSMNLRGCASLMELPDFTGIPNLRELSLARCQSLVEVHHSVGFLDKLETLDVDYCSKLIRLPRQISLKSVHTISLENCERLEEFPKITGTIDFLRDLDLSFSNIRELDSSIGNLIGLTRLCLKECKNFTTLPCNIYELRNVEVLDVSGCSKLATFPTNARSLLHDDNGDGSLTLPKLKVLKMKGCNLSDGGFLMTLGCLETLTQLDLSSNSFVHLPACISKFVNLKKLDLHCCGKLEEIPELPPNIVQVDVSDCESLELSKVLEGKESQGIKWINLWNCNKLCNNLGYNMDKLSFQANNMHWNDRIARILQNNQENSPFGVVFPGSASEVPKWFDCWTDFIGNEDGPCNSCQFFIKISTNLKWGKIGLVICAISEGGDPYYGVYEVSINNVLRIRRPSGGYRRSSFINSKSDHVWLHYIPLPVERMAEVDQRDCSSPPPYYMYTVRLRFHRTGEMKLNSYGAHLVCQLSKEDEYSSNKVVTEPKIPVVEHSNYLDGAGVIW